jgi:hypothetical protein
VYLGTHPVWAYISQTARTVLAPFSFLSFPKLDLAPILGIALVFSLADILIRPAVIHLFQKFSS